MKELEWEGGVCVPKRDEEWTRPVRRKGQTALWSGPGHWQGKEVAGVEGGVEGEVEGEVEVEEGEEGGVW